MIAIVSRIIIIYLTKKCANKLFPAYLHKLFSNVLLCQEAITSQDFELINHGYSVSRYRVLGVRIASV